MLGFKYLTKFGYQSNVMNIIKLDMWTFLDFWNFAAYEMLDILKKNIKSKMNGV